MGPVIDRDTKIQTTFLKHGLAEFGSMGPGWFQRPGSSRVGSGSDLCRYSCFRSWSRLVVIAAVVWNVFRWSFGISQKAEWHKTLGLV